MKNRLMPICAVILAMGMASCEMMKEVMSEGDPVEPKEGIVAIWQADADPAIIMTYRADGTGNYKNDNELLDMNFNYEFVGPGRVKATFENADSLEYDVKTTTKYLWMTDPDGTNRLHKMGSL